MPVTAEIPALCGEPGDIPPTLGQVRRRLPRRGRGREAEDWAQLRNLHTSDLLRRWKKIAEQQRGSCERAGGGKLKGQPVGGVSSCVQCSHRDKVTLNLIIEGP